MFAFRSAVADGLLLLLIFPGTVTATNAVYRGLETMEESRRTVRKGGSRPGWLDEGVWRLGSRNPGINLTLIHRQS